MQTAATTELATLGSGCFWCVEAIYERVDGVLSVTSGYAGGHTPAPTYRDVCSGATGHAEVVRLEFDPARVSFEQLLEVFFATHDPTTLNRQGADVGTQYRSAIFTHSDDQARTARDTIRRLDAAGEFRDPIVTEVTPAADFFPAEDYHQDYFRLNPNAPYCRLVIGPKVRKFLKRTQP